MGQDDFGAAVKRALTDRGLTIQWLADQFGQPHSTVSTWLSRSAPPPPSVFRMEEMLEVAPGTISATLGYLPTTALDRPSVVDAIESDPLLTERGRRSLVAAYRALVE